MDDDLPSLKAQREAFRRMAGREIATERPRRRRTRRAAVVALVGALLVGGAATAAELISIGEPEPDNTPRRSEQLPRAGYQIAAVARDEPLSWAVGVYTGADGRACVLAGQLRTGQLGVIRDGSFSPYAEGTAGPCRQAGSSAVLYDVRTIGGRTIVYGRAPEGSRSVEVFEADRMRRRSRTGPGGAFIFVYDGRVAVAEIRQIVARDAMGRRTG